MKTTKIIVRIGVALCLTSQSLAAGTSGARTARAKEPVETGRAAETASPRKKLRTSTKRTETPLPPGLSVETGRLINGVLKDLTSKDGTVCNGPCPQAIVQLGILLKNVEVPEATRNYARSIFVEIKSAKASGNGSISDLLTPAHARKVVTALSEVINSITPEMVEKSPMLQSIVEGNQAIREVVARKLTPELVDQLPWWVRQAREGLDLVAELGGRNTLGEMLANPRLEATTISTITRAMMTADRKNTTATPAQVVEAVKKELAPSFEMAEQLGMQLLRAQDNFLAANLANNPKAIAIARKELDKAQYQFGLTLPEFLSLKFGLEKMARGESDFKNQTTDATNPEVNAPTSISLGEVATQILSQPSSLSRKVLTTEQEVRLQQLLATENLERIGSSDPKVAEGVKWALTKIKWLKYLTLLEKHTDSIVWISKTKWVTSVPGLAQGLGYLANVLATHRDATLLFANKIKLTEMKTQFGKTAEGKPNEATEEFIRNFMQISKNGEIESLIKMMFAVRDFKDLSTFVRENAEALAARTDQDLITKNQYTAFVGALAKYQNVQIREGDVNLGALLKTIIPSMNPIQVGILVACATTLGHQMNGVTSEYIDSIISTISGLGPILGLGTGADSGEDE